jgi:hypothetical protein
MLSVVLVSGEKLGEIFTYVSDTSFKCQRSKPMSLNNSFSDNTSSLSHFSFRKTLSAQDLIPTLT